MDSELLREYILKTFRTQRAAAEYWGMGAATLSKKINGNLEFTKREMGNIKKDCKMPWKDFLKIFFS